MWGHLSALAGYVIPLGGLFGPLILWLVNRDRHSFIDEQGKEAVNFRLTMYLYYMASLVLVLVVIGLALVPLLCLVDLLLIIVAGIRTSRGEHFRYPLTVRIIR